MSRSAEHRAASRLTKNELRNAPRSVYGFKA
jgi:hypothetical protein